MPIDYDLCGQMSQFNVYTYCSLSIVCFNKEKVLVGIFSGHCEISRSPIDSSSGDAAEMLEITRCVALIVTAGAGEHSTAIVHK